MEMHLQLLEFGVIARARKMFSSNDELSQAGRILGLRSGFNVVR